LTEKTGKQKTIALNRQAVKALSLYFTHKRGDYIFMSNRKDGKTIGRVQAWRTICVAVNAIGAACRNVFYSRRKYVERDNMWSSHPAPLQTAVSR